MVRMQRKNGRYIARMVEIVRETGRRGNVELSAAGRSRPQIFAGAVTAIQRRQQIPRTAKTHVRSDAEAIRHQGHLPGTAIQMLSNDLAELICGEERQVREYDAYIARSA